jgi:hypothetical protein
VVTSRPTRVAIVAVLAAGVGACNKFQDPNIVVDLRVIAMTASVPEQVIDVDLAHPPPAAQLLAQLVPSEVCALVADPSFDGRRLRWSMTLCPPTADDRCDDGRPLAVIGSGVIEDPDLTVPEPRMCATIQPDGNLLAVVADAVQNDSLNGFGGEPYMVSLKVGGEGADPALDLFAAKAVQVAARIPATRTPNHNPTITRYDVTPASGGDPFPLAFGRCVDQAAPLVVKPGDKLRILPIEPDGAREVYVVPTLDGGGEMFTENLSYQWTAGAGGFSSGKTGGPRDRFGNYPPLFREWTAPSKSDLAGASTLDVPIWIVQRDERLGAVWYESCARVVVP